MDASAHILPPFPRADRQAPEDSCLSGSGVALRSARPADLPAFARLYALWRLPDLLLAPWSATQKQAFLDDQFRLQHRHFVRHFARGDFWALTRPGETAPIGRFYLDRTSAEWCVIDLMLAPEAQGQGAGSALLDWTQHSARDAGAAGVTLHVGINNPRAHALYRRLGFQDRPGGDGSNLPMRWTP